jgi:hypothetical protein
VLQLYAARKWLAATLREMAANGHLNRDSKEWQKSGSDALGSPKVPDLLRRTGPYNVF